MPQTGAKGLFLLFARGKRPAAAAIRAFAEEHHTVALGHDPSVKSHLKLAADHGEAVVEDSSSPDHGDGKTQWIELLREGLAFDLEGLEPGDPAAFPQPEHRFDLEALPTPSQYEAVQLKPGHHLAGGERTMPVARGLIGLARDLLRHFDDAAAVIWPPSSSAIGHRFFESITTAWLEGGPFPALGLTAFRETMDGALESIGLGFWIDQELRIEPPLSADKVAATRMGVRLVNQLILVGGVEGSERIIGPDGSRLVLRPSRNGQYIRVWRE